jgi:hypothetical protein
MSKSFLSAPLRHHFRFKRGRVECFHSTYRAYLATTALPQLQRLCRCVVPDDLTFQYWNMGIVDHFAPPLLRIAFRLLEALAK